jgi:predicted dehydrogenase
VTVKKKLIRCGVIGLGRSGWNIHVNSILKNRDFLILGVCDVDPKVLRKATKLLKCKGYINYIDLLNDEDIDLIIVSTTTKTHYTIASKALKAKKHVLLEKPLTSNILEMKNLKKLSKKNSKFIIPFFNFRFAKEFNIIEDILYKKLIGDVFLIKRNVSYFNRRDDWQAKKSESGGIINAAAIHHLDQIIQLKNKLPVDVWKDLKQVVTKGDTFDHSKILMKFADGCIADIEVSWASALAGYPWHILGTQGSIRQIDNILECKWFDKKDVEKKINQKRSYYANEKIKWKKRKFILDKKYAHGISPTFYKKIYNSIVKNETLPVKIESIISMMTMLKKYKIN